jgi:hypothetical protein
VQGAPARRVNQYEDRKRIMGVKLADVLSQKAKTKFFRPRDLMATLGLDTQEVLLRRVRSSTAYAGLRTALGRADAEPPLIILTENNGQLSILHGRDAIVAHFELDKERLRALIIDDRDAAAVQRYLSAQRLASKKPTPQEEEELLWRHYSEV